MSILDISTAVLADYTQSAFSLCELFCIDNPTLNLGGFNDQVQKVKRDDA